MKEESILIAKLMKYVGYSAKMGANMIARQLGRVQVACDPRLAVGFDRTDDASIYSLTDELALVQAVDFFPPITDDPYLFGQIAATAALSHIYAMGGDPRVCLNVMTIPDKITRESVYQVLRGSNSKIYEAGAVIAGGHCVPGNETRYGLSVTGLVHPDKVLTFSTAHPGDILILTKPIGIGALVAAKKAHILSETGNVLMSRLMTTLNKAARDTMIKYKVHACANVTDYGLLGHSYEMALSSGVGIALNVKDIEFIPEALAFARMGLLSAGMYHNRTFIQRNVAAGATELAKQDLLYEPQISGGLLISVAPEDAKSLLRELNGNVPNSQCVGVVVEFDGRRRVELC